jgi:hypothetical protein
MPTFCRVCASAESQQALIDRRLLDGASLAALSADDGLPMRELRHDRDAHVVHRATLRRPQRPAALMP